MTNDKQRERLVELLEEADQKVQEYILENDHMDWIPKLNELLEVRADYLLANGVIVPHYNPFPMVLSEDENNSDVYCPFCNTDLSGYYYGGYYEPPNIVTCFGCGTWLDGTKAITKEEAEQALNNIQNGNSCEGGAE